MYVKQQASLSENEQIMQIGLNVSYKDVSGIDMKEIKEFIVMNGVKDASTWK